MALSPLHVLQTRNPSAADGPPACGPARPAAAAPVLLAGGAGVLGRALLERLAGRRPVQVLAAMPLRAALAGVDAVAVPADWLAAGCAAQPANPPAIAALAVVQFEAASDHAGSNGRERAFWTPAPQQLLPLARWLHQQGVHTLCVVVAHATGRLPDAVKHGLANLDEQALAGLGFRRLLLVRMARDAARTGGGALLPRLAAAMLSIAGYMVPAAARPVRAVKVAELVDALLLHAPPGVHVVAPERVSEAAQGDAARATAAWFGPAGHGAIAEWAP